MDESPFVGMVRRAVFDEVKAFALRAVFVLGDAFFDFDAAL